MWNNDNRPIVYFDETQVNENHSLIQSWQNSDRIGGLKVPAGKGKRLTAVHAVGETFGFIPGDKLIY